MDRNPHAGAVRSPGERNGRDWESDGALAGAGCRTGLEG